MKSYRVATLLLLCSACSVSVTRQTHSPAPTIPDVPTQEIVQATQRLFDAMAARDTTTLKDLLHPHAQITGVGSRGVKVTGALEWIGGMGKIKEVPHERIWNPRVEMAGDMATLWASYDFRLGDTFSHCGTDAFQFIREGGKWRLIAVTFTVQREGCEASAKP